MLLPDSREVAVHIAGYTAKRHLEKTKSSSCCKMYITGSIDIENPDHEYLIILNRGGFKLNPLQILSIMCVIHLLY